MGKNNFAKCSIIILILSLLILDQYYSKNINASFEYIRNLMFYFAMTYIFFLKVFNNMINFAIIIIFIVVIILISHQTAFKETTLDSISSDILLPLIIYLWTNILIDFENKNVLNLKREIISAIKNSNLSKLMYFKL